MNKQPFILDLHEEEFPKIQELRAEELSFVSGGLLQRADRIEPCDTVTCTPNYDGGDDGTDECG